MIPVRRLLESVFPPTVRCAGSTLPRSVPGLRNTARERIALRVLPRLRCFVRLMDPGFLLIDNFARLVAILGIMISTPLFAWAGYLWMTSMGDPNRAAAARNAFISVGIGLVIIGCAFIIPSVIGESVVAPSGGIVYERDSGINCDGILREHLVANHQASDAARINFIIQRIQARFEDCTDLFWTPVARNDRGHIEGCFDGSTQDSISGVAVPRGLKRGGSVVSVSGRDARNNVIVHWRSSPGEGLTGLPSDSSICWMYVDATGSWVEGYD